MLPAPSSPAIYGIESGIVALAFLGFGYLLADFATARLRVDEILRWGLAVPAVAAYTLVLMLLHMASGGRVLSDPWLVRGLTLAAALVLVVLRSRRRRDEGRPEHSIRRELIVAGVMAFAALLAWGSPVGRLLPIDAMGDTPWHMGLASQILNGESTPAATVTGAVPNYYPWMFHAVIALLAQFTPGGRAFHALGPLQLFLAGGSALTLFALGRELVGTVMGGAAAALLGAVSGGFGFVRLRHLDVVMDPRAPDALRYLGDLTYKRSYNVAFANLSPPFPRDVALVLLMGFLLLVVVGLKRRNSGFLVAAGVTLGMGGLTGNESFLVGGGVAALVWLFAPPLFSRARVFLTLLVPAGVVFAIWLVPTVLSYLRLGGFVNITRVGAVNLTPVAIIGAWGISTPLAAYGFFRRFRDTMKDPGMRVLLALFVVAGGTLLGSVVFQAGFGNAFLSISRRHRFWPLLHLAITLYGAVGAALLIERLRQWRPWVAVAAGVAIVAVALPSPVLASVALPKEYGPPTVLKDSLRGDPNTVLNVLAGHGRCHVAVPADLAHRVFAYTGYRLVFYRWDDYRTNFARIRWKDIYQHIPGDQERLRDNQALVNGTVGAAAWAALARKYQLNFVVVPQSAAASPAFDGHAEVRAFGGAETWVVVELGPCPG